MDKKIEEEVKQMLTDFWHEESLDLSDNREKAIVIMDPKAYSEEAQKVFKEILTGRMA